MSTDNQFPPPHDEDSDLHAWLSQRASVPPRPFLAAHILQRTRAVPPQPISAMQWLRQLFIESPLPRPSYALAMMLLLGVALGQGIAKFDDSVKQKQELRVMQSFLSAEADL